MLLGLLTVNLKATTKWNHAEPILSSFFIIQWFVAKYNFYFRPSVCHYYF